MGLVQHILYELVEVLELVLGMALVQRIVLELGMALAQRI